MPDLPNHHISSSRSERRAFALVIVAVLTCVATIVVMSVSRMDCLDPVSRISNTLGSAVQRANEQPGTGYIRDPRQ